MQIGWIDFSQKERNKIVSILKMLGTQTALDELGIGSIRDAFSDLLFPGTSVLQTRAKYFVLVPYIFADAIKESYSSKRETADFIKKQEDKLVSTLSKNSPDEWGIIGILKGTAKNMPRSIYWNGLRTLGILKNPSYSLDSAIGFVYNKSRHIHALNLKIEDSDSAADDIDALRDSGVLFDPIVPDYPYINDADIYPTKKEAEYLKYHFTHGQNVKESLMAYMLNNSQEFFRKNEKNEIEPIYSFWDIDEHKLPNNIKSPFSLAKQFSEFIYGAHLLYNIIFAEGCKMDDDIVEIKKEYNDWLANYVSPDLNSIITITKSSPDVSLFLRQWDEASKAKDDNRARKIIIAREIQVKTGRAKLNHPDHYQYQKPIHYFRISYRYSTTVRLLSDILVGLEPERDETVNE